MRFKAVTKCLTRFFGKNQSHGFNQLSLTRPAAECKDMDNVLYVGASSRPGNGVPLVLIGAKSVADKAMRRIKAMSSLETDITITK